MSGSRSVVAALAIGMIAGPASAWAQAASEGETSESLFQQGRAAFADGKMDLARGYFQRSLDLDPAVGTLLNLAVCEERLGRLVSAIDHLNEALERTPPADKRRPLVLARIAELDRLTPRVILRTATALAPGVGVTLDARPVDQANLGKAVRLDPGRHDVNCTGPLGQQCPRTFILVEGQESEQVLDVVPSPAWTAVSPPAASDAPAPAAPPNRAVAYGIGVLGLAGLGAGLVTGVLVIDRKNTVGKHCTDKTCDPEGLSAAESGKTLSLVSTVVTGVGLAALGTSAYLFLSVPSTAKSSSMISVSGRF